MKVFSRVLVVLTVTIRARGQTPSSTLSSPVTTTLSESGLTATLTTTSSPASSAVPTSQDGCPTVTLTSNICQSCATPECIQLEPLTQSCGCPSAIPTVFVEYPCEAGCGGIGCAANYVFFTANCTSETSSPGLSSAASSSAALANSTASSAGPGPGGVNATAGGTTAQTETTTRSLSSTGTRTGTGTGTGTGAAASSSSSAAAAGRLRPFWAGLL